MRNLFSWNTPPDISKSMIRRIKLLNISCIVATGINFAYFVILLLASEPLLSLVNLCSIIVYVIVFVLTLQRKYFVSQILLIFGTIASLFAIQITYAGDIAAHLYMFPLVVLTIFIFTQRKIIFLSTTFITIFFFLIVFSAKFQWFTPLTKSAAGFVPYFWWSNLFGSIFMIIAFARVFRIETFSYEYKMQQQNNLLSEQKEELQQSFEELKAVQEILEQRQQDILQKNIRIEKLYKNVSASINYAQNIQAAILPTTQKIQQLLPNSFIFFKPRDVVSGDFYYLEKIEGKIILAAVDCTGHGVPGAFMSLIGNDLLNNIIHNKGIAQPAQILEQLHIGIRQLLRQKENNNHDGMDISMIAIDAKNQTVEFAGAKNPLVYIQNDELAVIKGDKLAIGGQQRELKRVFTTHKIDLTSPTSFYLFSDGIQDQFGGTDGKKFSPKRLRNLVLEIHQKPMLEQKKIVTKTLADWQHEAQEEQIDDMLLIGVRV